MRSAVLFLIVFLGACGSSDPGPDGHSNGPQGHHPIDQFEELDGGMVNVGAGSEDIRVAVAYCAAEVLLGRTPQSCTVLPADTELGLKTECDNLTIQWNCSTCGDAALDGTVIGHVLIDNTDSTLFKVKSNTPQAPLFYCRLDVDGTGFTIEQAS